MQVSLHSYSTSTGYHPTIKIVGFLARKFDKLAKIGSINWKTSRLPPIIIQAPCRAPETPPEVPTSKKVIPLAVNAALCFLLSLTSVAQIVYEYSDN